jgi:hypothetical protein
MGNWGHYLVLQAKSKTGLSPAILILGVLAGVTMVAALVLFCVAAFFLLVPWLGPLWTAVAMVGFFLLLSIIFAVAAIQSRKRAMERAQAALAARSTHALFDSSTLALGLQLGRTIGWKRLIPLAAVALIAMGVAKEWAARKAPDDDA